MPNLDGLFHARTLAFRAYDDAAAKLHAIDPDAEARTLAQLEAGNAFDRARDNFRLADLMWRDAVAVASTFCPSTWGL